MALRAGEPAGYADADLDRWAAGARAWARGRGADGLDTVAAPPPTAGPRDVFVYVISGEKALNPAAAMALIERIDGDPA